MKTKKCLHCGNEITQQGRRLFCSEHCHYTYWWQKRLKKQDHRTCKMCGKEFDTSYNQQKYCCEKCRYESKKPMNPIQKPVHIPKVKHDKICAFCGSTFAPHTTLDKYCSAACRINNHKSKRKFNWTNVQVLNRIGEKNPAYRNGVYAMGTKKITEGEWIFVKNSRELKDKMIQDRGFVYCQECNTSNSPRFETHHLIFRSEKPLHPHLHDKSNLIVLCIGCHNQYHKHKYLRNRIVEYRNLNQLFGNDVLNKTEFNEHYQTNPL